MEKRCIQASKGPDHRFRARSPQLVQVLERGGTNIHTCSYCTYFNAYALGSFANIQVQLSDLSPDCTIPFEAGIPSQPCRGLVVCSRSTTADGLQTKPIDDRSWLGVPFDRSEQI
jgi:hypothetical protein